MKDFNRNLNEENIQMTNEDFKTCFASYVIKKLQITATLILLHTCGQNPEQWQHQVLVWMRSNRKSCALLLRVQTGVATLQDSLAVSYKTKHTFTMHPAIVSVCIYTKELKTWTQSKTCTWMFIISLVSIAKTWKQARCPSVKWMETMEYSSALKRNEPSNHKNNVKVS